MNTSKKTYSKLITLSSFDDRFNYLKLDGSIGAATFGSHRFLNQDFYRGKIWRDFRNYIIVRDNGLDLAHRDHPIGDNEPIYIHHINPLTIEELMDDFDSAIDEQNAISTSFATHQAIHYGSKDYTKTFEFAERTLNDTCPWRHKKENDDDLFECREFHGTNHIRPDKRMPGVYCRPNRSNF